MPRRKPAGGADDNPVVDQPEAVVAPPGGADDHEDALQQLLAGLDDPSGHEVCIFEREQDGTRRMLTRAGVADFDPWRFAEQYGGGDYEMRVREIDSKRWVRQRAFSVSRRVPRRDAAPGQASPSPAAAAAPDNSRDMLALMMGLVQSQAQQQTAILTALIGRPQNDPPIKLGDVAALIEATRAAEKPAGDMAGLVAAVKELHTLSGGISGAASEDVELAKAFAPVIGQLLQAQPQQQQQQRAAALTPPRANAPTDAGGVAAGAHAAAQPASPQPTDAPAPPLGPASAAVDTLAAIALRIGLDAGGALDSTAITRIAHQAAAAIDIEALAEAFAAIPAGELPRHVIAATPAMAREHMQQHVAALAQIETYLRELVADLEDEQDKDPTDART